jgi:GT2 family glycosyltransferase
MVFAVTTQDDLPAGDLGGVRALICDVTGSCHQRNMGLSAVADAADVIAFFDDDYVPSSRCVEGIATIFAERSDVVAANGVLLADGVNSPGISYADAQTLIDHHDRMPAPAPEIIATLSGLYGCNMAFRASAIGAERFDERLPLYAWQEDIDFAARVGKNGAIVRTNAFYGVHQGVKGARLSGLRLGYSQVVNPLYLIRKGTMAAGEALPLIIKNVMKNHARALFPEPWIDRLGRC